MRVKIGPYINWFGPYQLAKKLMFWVPDEKDEYGFPTTADRVHKFGEWLAHGSIEPETEVGEVTQVCRDRPTTWLCKLLAWIHSKKNRKVEVHIDRWDTWNMDDTLAHIILPMLKQLKETKHGSPPVDMEDVPEHLRSEIEDHSSQIDLFEHVHLLLDEDLPDDHKRWEWVLDEMIFAFENKVNDDWESEFEKGESDLQWKKLEDGMSEMVRGPNDTKEYDWEGRKKYQARISNGFRLFGKYYEGLWD